MEAELLAPDALTQRRLKAAAARLTLFDVEDYRALNPDLAEVEPYTHFARFGAWEGRNIITPERLTAGVSRAIALAPPERPAADLEALFLRAGGLRARVRLPAGSPPESRRMARHIAGLVTRSGAEAEVWEGVIPALAEAALPTVVVDPRGLFGPRAPDAGTARQLARAVVLVAGAPGDPAFTAALPFALVSRGALCLEAESRAVLAHSGLPSVWIGAAPASPEAAATPPDHPLIAGLSSAARASPPDLPWAERPIDLAALEDVTPARTSAWKRMAEGLAEHALVVRRPVDAGAHLPLEAEARRFVFARSKLVLHLHAAAPAPPPAQACIEAAGGRAALLCEPSPAHPVLRAGVHFIESSARRMPERVAQVLAEPETGGSAARRLRTALARRFDAERLGLEIAAMLTPIEPARR